MPFRKQYCNKEWRYKYFDIRMAIVQVKSRETDTDAWRRHVKERPKDRYVKVRVFHREPEAVGSIL